MRTLTLTLASIVLVSCTSTAPPRTAAPSDEWVRVYRADGTGGAAFIPLPSAYVYDGPSVSVFVHGADVGKTALDQPVRGAKFIGWKEGDATRVTVYALLGEPADWPEMSERAPRDLEESLMPVQIGVYHVTRGARVTIDALERYGMKPMTIALEEQPKNLRVMSQPQ